MRKLLLLCLLVLSAGCAWAVTDKEMDHARAIAAREYLRWANDGSGYLDEMTFSSMSQLESGLKAKEKENIKSFKAVKTPSDYASWDKAALVKYWSETFFASPGLIDKGRAAKGRVRKKVSALTIAPPAPAQEKAEPSPAKEETPAASAASAADTAAAAPQPEELQRVEQQIAATDSLAVADESLSERPKKQGTPVWVYILVLGVLVGVVIWLVIFASKTMKSGEDFHEVDEQKPAPRRRAPKEEVVEEEEEVISVPAATSVAAVPAVAADFSDRTDVEVRLREKYAESLARKNEEIRALNREILDLREENLRLGEEKGRLKAEIASLRAAAERAAADREVASSREVARETIREAAPAPRQEAAPAPRRRRPAQSEIYLGRVNARGLFVRADREFVADKSVFRLVTSDGLTGSYRVVEDPAMQDRMLDDPEEYLAGGCVAKDIDNTDGMMEIITESAGTALFEEGCWRVLRKAKISYR